ncbi:MAG TPA: hypothetical protein VII99_15995 [Bacteroidia bacterium]
MTKEIIYLKKGSVSIIEKGIIRFTLNENAVWELPDAKETHKANLKLSKGKKFCQLYDGKHFFIPDKKALAFSSSKICTNHRIAMAIVIKKLGLQIFADHFIHNFKSKSPTRIFRSKALALKWLRNEYKKASKD